MKSVFYSSKEEIRNRILKNAEDFWNIKNPNDFDPLVKLILEAISNELFNVSNDVKNLENRIFDKMSRILASDHLTSALPAHAILHAKPLEKTDFASPSIPFIYKKKLVSEGEKNDSRKSEIFFSSLHKVKLHNAEVKYVASHNTLYSIINQHKTPMLSTNPGSYFEKNSMYIGITGLKDWNTVNGLNLYFDWKNYAVPENSYDLISLSRWFAEEQPIQALTDHFMDEETDGPQTAPFQNKKLLSKLKEDILQFYSKRFLTLSDLDVSKISPNQNYPSEFEALFPTGNLKILTEEIKWIKVIFPAALHQDMLRELSVTINAFPVVNKKMMQIKHRLKTMNNIIPIKTEALEQMLDIESLKDNKGKNYNEIPYANENDQGDGSYSVRYGGTERFDTRNAKELVDYLFELLRDEKAAFSAHGPDFLNTSLKNLEQNINLIEQKSMNALKDIKELPSYVVVKPIDNADILFLDLWLTQAENANKIAAGNRLECYENNRFYPESLILQSATKGGRARLNSTNRVQAYKYGLTTADRIVTKADILSFCHYELGNNVKNISLAKGLMMDTKPNAGFVKTTDILIEPSAASKFTGIEWQELFELTQAKLTMRSTMNVHYRLLLK